jgi:PPOX class probable F420-dependent enzyme
VYVRTGKLAAKVKRIRSDPHVKLAPCTVRGKPVGPYAEGTARVVPPHEEGKAEQALQANYGLGRRLYEESAASFDAHYIEIAPS